jgi:hypothetical protein
MYSSAFCNVGLQVYILKPPNFSLDKVEVFSYWLIQNDCGQVWQLRMKIYVATVWMR